MKEKLFALVLGLLCVCVYAQTDGVIEDELQNVLNQKNDDMIEISISFKSQVSSDHLQAKAKRSDDRSVRREVVVNELKSHSESRQADVMSILQAEELGGKVMGIKSLWIVNAVSCKATPDVIYKLASHPDVAVLSYDKEIQMIEKSRYDEAEAHNAATALRGPASHVVTVNADDVWSLGYTGRNVVVAVLDSGTNINHEDLKDHLWKGEVDGEIVNGWNVTVNNSNIVDDNGHGTHCAGIVCGDGTSGTTTGIAPDASLMTVKTVSAAGTGSVSNMIDGVQFAVENGADIISISSGFKNSDITVEQKELLRETFNMVLTSGVVVCAAVGNDADNIGAPYNVDFPAACPSPWKNPDQTLAGGLSSVIAVGANDYSQSSHGPSTWQDTKFNDYSYNPGIGLIRPDISAPGNFIYSLDHIQNTKYDMKSGSSQSTPCVAGTIALMLEKNPSLSPAEIAEIIETTAADKPASKDNVVGAGRVDAIAAMNAVVQGEQNPYVRLTSFSPKTLTHSNGQQIINLTFTNQAMGASSENTRYAISLNDNPYVTLDGDNVVMLGVIDPQSTKESSFKININPQTPNMHVLYATLTITDGDMSWEDKLALQITSLPNIVFKSCSPSVIKPEDGNVELNVVMQNNGTAPSLNNTEVTLSSISSSLQYVDIIDNTSSVAPLGINETGTASFIVSAKENATDGYLLDFFLETFIENNAEISIAYGFENDLEGWTTFDADDNNGVNNTWWHSSLAFNHGKNANDSHAGSEGHLMSETYYMSQQELAEPIDDYLVSPHKVMIGENSGISFYARANHKTYYAEHFAVAVSENGNASENDFTTIKEWHVLEEQGTEWNKYYADLSQYKGKEIYVAIRHFFTKEEWTELDYGFYVDALNVDDVEFLNIIMDYHNEPTYSNDDDNYFNVIISNPIDLDVPTGLTLSNITTNSVTLSWNALSNAQSYNVYRNGELLANVETTEYTDNNLCHNTEYCYSVAGLHNSNVYGQCEEVCATTAQTDYSVAIKEYSPETVFMDGNLTTSLNITFINDGRLEHESRSAITLSSKDQYVNINTATSNMNALLPQAEHSSSFQIVIDESVPNNHIINFNVNVTSSYGSSLSLDLPLSISVKNDPNVPKNLKVNDVTYNSVALSWNVVADALRYNIYRDEEFAGTTAAMTFIDGGLEADTEYTYYVTSINGNSDESEKSNVVTVKTNVVNDGIVLQSFTMGGAIGEAVELVVTLINKGDEATSDKTSATLSCNDYYVDILNGTANLGSVQAGETKTANFIIKLDEDIPTNYNLTFNVVAEYEASGIIYKDFEYDFDSGFDGWRAYDYYQIDNHTWYHSSETNAHGLSTSNLETHRGAGYIMNKSYCYSHAVKSSNDIVWSPERITIGEDTKISFYVRSTGTTPTYCNDSYYVVYSDATDDPEGNFVNSLAYYTLTQEEVNQWNYKEYSLSSQQGKKIWVGILHQADSKEADGLCIDDVIFKNVPVEGNSIFSNTSSFSVIANQSLNIFAGDGLWGDATKWSKGMMPTSTDDVLIDGDASLEDVDVVVNSLYINSGRTLTLNTGAKLGVNGLFVNNDADAFVVNDGAQVRQNNENVAATFNMNIVNWNDDWSGWQFIASPIRNAKVADFVLEETEYDLFKYDGNQELQWVNYDNHVDDFETTFVQGRGYLVSYKNENTAGFKGYINHESEFDFSDVDAYNPEDKYANFYLIGNPFSFNINWNDFNKNNVYDGIARVNYNDGSYDYDVDADVEVGDGFFVMTTAINPSLSYDVEKQRKETEERHSINIVVTGKAGSDNVVVNLNGYEETGFVKLDNFNKEIAELYFSKNNNRYAIMSFDENINEVDVDFDAKEIGKYTITAKPEGKFGSVVLVDKLTGIETNLLLEDYTFTATSDENHKRFVVKFVNGQESTANSHFVYQSGEELILNIQGEVQIVDVLGRVVYNGKAVNDINRINVSEFSNGTYMVRVVNEEGVKVEKIIL